MDQIKLIKNKKFKNILISLRFSSPKNSAVTARALLAMMLGDRSEKYHSKVLMNEKLDQLFGAQFSTSVLNYGKAHVLELSLSALSFKYVEEDLLSQQLEFLSEVLYHPLLNEATFEESKLVLKDLIERESDSLNSYVILESLKIAGKGYPLELSKYGDLESLDNVTLEDVKKEYQSLINKDNLNVMVVGDVDEDQVSALFDKFFKKHESNSFDSSYLVKDKQGDRVVYKDIVSPYFSIVYNTHTLNTGRDYWALQLMSMVLGQLPNSLLFQEVREKRSLCYSIRSLVSGYDGVLIITAGVRSGHDQEAIELSQEQVLRIVNEGVSDSLFKSAKTMMINSIKQTEDSGHRLIDSQYRRLILNEDLDNESLIALIQDINMEDIRHQAKCLELNTIYTLRKEESDE